MPGRDGEETGSNCYPWKEGKTAHDYHLLKVFFLSITCSHASLVDFSFDVSRRKLCVCVCVCVGLVNLHSKGHLYLFELIEK